MNDRELLELAAKAAGYSVRWVDAFTSFNVSGFRVKTGVVLPGGLGDIEEEAMWNPLEDDGDALRLAVKMGFVLDFSKPDEAEVSYWTPGSEWPAYAQGRKDHRRAIVRAAAALCSKEHE